MNQLYGRVFTGLITDENEQNYFVQKKGQTFQLSKEEGNFQLGEAVEGFGFLNQKKAAAFTLTIPEAQLDGQYGWGVVTGVRRDLGVFVDIGLPGKDIAISLDGLPSEKKLWPKTGDFLYVTLTTDEKGRVWGEVAEENVFSAMANRGEESMKNQNLSGIVFRLKLAGTYVWTENSCIGFIHPSERLAEPRLGEKVQTRVIGVRPDGILNLSLKPRAHEAIEDDSLMILAFLERSANGRIPYTDKTSKEEIQAVFGISKGQFKRALGRLMKQKKVKQENGETILFVQK